MPRCSCPLDSAQPSKTWCPACTGEFLNYCAEAKFLKESSRTSAEVDLPFDIGGSVAITTEDLIDQLRDEIDVIHKEHKEKFEKHAKKIAELQMVVEMMWNNKPPIEEGK